MHNVAWIINSDSMSAFPAGLSDQYLIPKGFINNLDSVPEQFRLFVIERQEFDRLIAILTISGYQIIDDGPNSNDYLLNCDLYKSIRVCNHYYDAGVYQLDCTIGLGYGLSVVEDFVSSQIVDKLFLQSNVQFNTPTDSFLSRAEIPAANARKFQSIIKESVKQILTKYTLSEIWSDSSDFYKRPVSYFAYKLISKSKYIYDDNLIKIELLNIDPFNFLKIDTKSSDHMNVSGKRRFDSSFVPVNINNIKYVKYKESELKLDIASMLSKTEKAYQNHQDILSSLCNYLGSKSIQTYQTNSVDLMYECQDKIKIIEIKSANLDNIFSQVASGVIQLGYYAQRLSEEYISIGVILVIEKISDSAKMSEALSSLDYFKIPYFIYDRNDNFHDRWSGFLDL